MEKACLGCGDMMGGYEVGNMNVKKEQSVSSLIHAKEWQYKNYCHISSFFFLLN